MLNSNFTEYSGIWSSSIHYEPFFTPQMVVKINRYIRVTECNFWFSISTDPLLVNVNIPTSPRLHPYQYHLLSINEICQMHKINLTINFPKECNTHLALEYPLCVWNNTDVDGKRELLPNIIILIVFLVFW